MNFGYIYKIIHNQSDICYIGSTINIKIRWQAHKDTFKKFLKYENQPPRCSIYPYFKKLGIINFKLIIIKKYEIFDRKQLNAYEQLWINKLKNINKNGAFISLNKKNKYDIWNNKRKEKRKEFYNKNKDEILEKHKEYYEENKLKINEKRKEVYKENKEKHKEKHKEYRIKNKEILKEKSKEYYKENKEKINEKHKEFYNKNKEKFEKYKIINKERIKKYNKDYRIINKEILKEKYKEILKEKIECICGSIINKNKLKRHQLTKKHLGLK